MNNITEELCDSIWFGDEPNWTCVQQPEVFARSRWSVTERAVFQYDGGEPSEAGHKFLKIEMTGGATEAQEQPREYSWKEVRPREKTVIVYE